MKAFFHPAQNAYRALLICFALLAAGFGGERSAHAQGAYGSFADPITSQELETYAQRLNLSDDQYRSLLDAHDTYKTEFQKLQENEIAEYRNDASKIQTRGTIPERKPFEKLIKGARKLNERIARLDNSLFDALAPMLTDEQQALLPRLKMQRERARYSSNRMMAITGSTRGTQADLVGMEIGRAHV